MLAQDFQIGYCTNVHAGVDLDAIRDNLQWFAVPVQQSVCDSAPLGVGLWLPAKAASQLVHSGADDFAKFLSERNLHPYTVNGFPFDNFHQDVVKHRVYSPPWWDERRLSYTRQLAAILSQILPEDEPVGSISTLPIGWAANPCSPGEPRSADELARSGKLDQAGENLRSMADSLQKLERRSGRRIVLAIEPEPGCILDTTDDCIEWFDRHLPEPHHRRYITVCHDICHAAVMMENQRDVLTRLSAAGIGVGKVQVSSAIVADWESMAAGRRGETLEQLSQFAEDRYLHQTGRRTETGGFELAEDLPALLAKVSERAENPAQSDPLDGDRRWVVHFHVPIFLEHLGHLTTSHDDVIRTLQALHSADSSIEFTGHLEVETYAWSVLPESMRKRGLAEDIAREITWLREEIGKLPVNS